MKKVFILISLILSAHFIAAAQTAAVVSLREQSWSLGKNLSNAALVNSMSDDAALVNTSFSAAQANARNLRIKLPPLPAKTGDKIQDQAAAVSYLLNTTGQPIMKILNEDLGATHAALFELAFKMNLLLLFSDGKEAQAIVSVIDKRQAAAGLTPEVFADLKALIISQSSYKEIKEEIFKLQRLVPMFVAVGEYSDNGEALYAQKNYAGSAAQFSQALQISPEEPKFFFLRARAYMQGSRYPEAIADYTKVIQYAQSAPEQKNLPIVYHNRGLCYALSKRYAQALPDLNMAIKLNPAYASAYKIRSLVYKQTGSIKLANADYQRAESLQPGIMN